MNIAIILAAGSGTRMGNASVPKQFLMIYNKPIVVHTIEQFEMHFDIDEIVVVTKKITSMKLRFGFVNLIYLKFIMS